MYHTPAHFHQLSEEQGSICFFLEIATWRSEELCITRCPPGQKINIVGPRNTKLSKQTLCTLTLVVQTGNAI